MLDSVVRGAAERFGDKVAFATQDGRSLTFADLDRRADRSANHMAAHGVGDGSIVALRLPSDLDYVVCYAAAARLGAAIAGINPSLTSSEARRLIEVCRPTLEVDEALAAQLTADGPPLDREPLEADPERVAAIVFTSGTTGTPKGAIFRHRQIESISCMDLGVTADDLPNTWGDGPPMLSSTQFAHIGFTTKLAWYLRTGSTVHLLERWSADAVLEAVARERIPVIGAVAPQIALLLRSNRIDELDLTCVRLLVVGGAASPPGLIRAACERFDAAYSIRYSSTESGGVGLAATVQPGDEPTDSIGSPRPGVDARIIDGELCLRSPAMFDGYLNDPQATASALRDGWLHTGDAAELTGDGQFRLSGRLGDMYIRGGYNVHPGEVEAVLSEHAGVASIAIAPYSDAVLGEKGAAFVVPTGTAHPTLDELRDFGAQHLARWKLPERLFIVDDIPLTAMQKVDRAALRQAAEADTEDR